MRNQQHALAHEPRLIDDPYQNPQNTRPNSSELEFRLLNATSPSLQTTKNSANRPLLSSLESDTRLLSREELNVTKLLQYRKNAKIDFNDIVIDTTLIIPTYVYNDANAYYSTHRAKLRNVPEGNSKKSVDNNQEMKQADDDQANDDDEYEIDFCLKIFECDAIEKSMLDPIYENLLKFKKLEHDNLGIIYDVNFKIDNNENLKRIEILSPWYSGGSLFDIIDMSPKDTPFAMHVIKRMVLQIATFMNWLHKDCKIPHGHLKSRNILFDNEMNVQVTDIGLISLKKTMNVLLPDSNFDGYWLDKEYFQGKPIKPECDVWAFGFILYELVAKKQPFQEVENDINYIKKCIISNENMPELPQHCPDVLTDLVKQCWNPIRSERPTFEAIVEIVQTQMS